VEFSVMSWGVGNLNFIVGKRFQGAADPRNALWPGDTGP